MITLNNRSYACRNMKKFKDVRYICYLCVWDLEHESTSLLPWGVTTKSENPCAFSSYSPRHTIQKDRKNYNNVQHKVLT